MVETNLGASVSLVPFRRQSWRINHYGDPKWDFVPEHSGTVRAMIFQLQQNGAPGFLRPFMTDDGRKANIAFFYPDQKGETILFATHYAEKFIEVTSSSESVGSFILRSHIDCQDLTDYVHRNLNCINSRVQNYFEFLHQPQYSA